MLANTTPAWESNNSFFFKQVEYFPHFPFAKAGRNLGSYQRIPSLAQVSFKSSLRLRMLCKFGWAGRFSKLAELVVPMEAIRYLKNPTHAWLEVGCRSCACM